KRLWQLLTALPSACSSTRLNNYSELEFFNNGLRNPLGEWVGRDGKMDNLPPLVPDDEKDIEHLECNVRDCKEVDPSDHFAIIFQEGYPV
ncbi:MAG: hypothetical protein GY866_14005, partial [Proteobacteria bacterium]|nr:hypothetical protein [Pseudomonadota bacterium]